MDDTTFDRLLNIQTYDDEALRELAQRLSEEERELSKRRRLLHGEIDIVRAELVRRLRDKHAAGQDVVADGYLTALTDILSGRSPMALDEEIAPAGAPSLQEPLVAPPSDEPLAQGHPYQERRFYMQTDVREERLIRYVLKHLSEGRHLDDILGDGYMMSHASETKRAELMQNPQIIKAVQESIKRHFGDQSTRPAPKKPESK